MQHGSSGTKRVWAAKPNLAGDELRAKIQMRRRLAGVLLCMVITHPRPASAQTGIYALDMPAIAVKDPAANVLIDVANAGKRLVAVGEHGLIVYSDDDGQSWTQAAVPVDVTLTTVSFANASNGWAAGHYGVVLHSTDGGMIWREQLNGLQANQLTLKAAQVAVARNDPSPGTSLAIVRANHFVADGPDKPFLSILASDAKSAIIFGAYRMTVRTTDGGKNWADWSLQIYDPFSHNLYAAARVGKLIYAVGETGLVFSSNDDAGTFSPVTASTNATMLMVLPAGADGVFVGGIAGQAFRSDDVGKSWHPVTFDTAANLTAGEVLSSGGILVGTEAGELYISSDGAHNFRRLTQVLPMAIYGLAQAHNGNIVAAGSSGVLTIPASDLANQVATKFGP